MFTMRSCFIIEVQIIIQVCALLQWNYLSCIEETPSRIRVIYQALEKLLTSCEKISIRKATQEELETVHSKEFVAKIFAIPSKLESTGNEIYRFPNDQHTYVSRGSMDAARCAAGGVIEATAKVITNKLANAFAIVRPPGHHCRKDEAMGFCLFNNIAVAAKLACELYGLKRVLIIDWDVHYGNGTAEIFAESSSVLYISIHRYQHGAFYPGTGDPNNVGIGNGKGFTVNLGWNSIGMADADYLFAFQHLVLPVSQEFNPEIVLISAGFDAAEGDIHGEMKVTPKCFGQMTRILLQLAQGKVVVALEGGYNLESNAKCAFEVLQELLSASPSATKGSGEANDNLDNTEQLPSLECILDLLQTLHIHSSYWTSAKAHLKEVESFKSRSEMDLISVSKQVQQYHLVKPNESKSRRSKGANSKQIQYEISHIKRAPRRTAEAIWKNEIFKLERRQKEIHEILHHISDLQKQSEKSHNKLAKRDYAEIGKEEQYKLELDEVTEELNEIKYLSKEEAILLFSGRGGEL